MMLRPPRRTRPHSRNMQEHTNPSKTPQTALTTEAEAALFLCTYTQHLTLSSCLVIRSFLSATRLFDSIVLPLTRPHHETHAA